MKMATINNLERNKIDRYLKDYIDIRDPNQRYASYDYCYNYFRSFVNSSKTSEIANADNMQTSCIQLGFYLASWGMYRGSSQILQQSAKGLEKVIQVIATTDSAMFKIDVDKYDLKTIPKILDLKECLQAAFSHTATTTL